MQYEKSCGAVIYRKENGERKYLLILNQKGNADGHWGFAKGHVEMNETELETAEREILEETGLSVDLIDDFRYVNSYHPKPDVLKDVVYFIATARNGEVSLQVEEVAQFRWCGFDEAFEILTYDQDLLGKVDEFLNGC